MFNFAYQLELMLNAAKPPLYLSEKMVNRRGPLFVKLHGRPGGFFFQKLLSLFGLAPASRTIEVYSDRIEYSLVSKWFQSSEKVTFSTICSMGHQFFRFPHFLILAWLSFIYAVLSIVQGIKNASDDNASALPFVIAVVLIIAGIIFLYLYFKCKRFVIFAYTNCGKGILFTIQPKSSFIFKPEGAVDFSNDDIIDIVNFIGELVDRNKASSVSIHTAPIQNVPGTPATAAAPMQSTSSVSATAPVTAQVSASAAAPGAAPTTATAQGSVPIVETVSRYNAEDCLSKCLKKKDLSHENDLVYQSEPLSDDPDFQDALSLAQPIRQAQLLGIQYLQAEQFLKELLMTYGLSNESELVTCSNKVQDDPNWLKALKCASPEREKELRTLLEKRGTEYYLKKVMEKYKVSSEEALIKKSVVLYFTSKIEIKKNEDFQCALACFPENRKTELLDKMERAKRCTNNIVGLVLLFVLIVIIFLLFVVPNLK